MSWSASRYHSTPQSAKQKFSKPLDEVPPSQHLTNGGVGIDYYQIPKSTNLANSAVLKMLKEQQLDETDRSKSRYPGIKEVVWPPPSENLEDTHTDMYSPQYQNSYEYNNHTDSSSHSSATFRPVHFSPPPTTITLRSSAPISQSSAPVFASQPVTATIRGGTKSRGDQKWPPENYKKQIEAENEARVALAKGPVFRPRKVNRDYQPFFAQNALPNTYPGYKVPPGTQHYFEPQHTTDL